MEDKKVELDVIEKEKKLHQSGKGWTWCGDILDDDECNEIDLYADMAAKHKDIILK